MRVTRNSQPDIGTLWLVYFRPPREHTHKKKANEKEKEERNIYVLFFRFLGNILLYLVTIFVPTAVGNPSNMLSNLTRTPVALTVVWSQEGEGSGNKADSCCFPVCYCRISYFFSFLINPIDLILILSDFFYPT